MKTPAVMLCACLFAMPSYAQSADEKHALVDSLLELTGQSVPTIASQFSRLFNDSLTRQLRASYPNLPAAANSVVKEEVDAVIYSQLIASDAYANAMREIYTEALTGPQLRELLTFYRSDLGKTLLRVTPAINARSSQLGREYGERLSAEIRRRVSRRLEKEELL
jgi:hypothetical protein